MKFMFCPRIWLRFFSGKRPLKRFRSRRRGAAMLMVLALSLLFSAIGLSLIFLTQVSLKSSLIKKNTIVLDILSENGLKQGYLSVHSQLAGRPFPLPIENDRLFVLKADVEKKGTALVEEALGGPALLVVRGGWEGQSWEASIGFILDRFQDLDSYFRAEFRAVIASRGILANSSAARSASLEASLIIMAGSIPLAFFPVLLSTPGQPGEPGRLPDLSGLTILPQPGGDHLVKVLSPEESLLPQDARPALEKALQVKLFSPQDLSPRRLRQALGLEDSEDPVPDGVYLVRSDLGLGGIYVQGDLEELILAVIDGAQVIFFRNREAEWILRFNPVQGWTEFAGPGSTVAADDLLEPVIIVDGAVKSMGGGRPDGTGRLQLCSDGEMASILRGVRLVLVSSGRIVLSSHLLQEGVVWQQGFPYIKESESQLFIFSTGADMTSGAATEGGISIGPQAPADLKIQAELVASGGSFRIEGGAKSVHLLGSLQAADIDLGSNRLAVSQDPGLFKDNDLAGRLLGTAFPVLLVSSFKPLIWRDNDR